MGGAFIVLYMIGIPAAFFLFLWQTARPVKKPDLLPASAAEWDKLRARRVRRYALLYKDYEEGCALELSCIPYRVVLTCPCAHAHVLMLACCACTQTCCCSRREPPLSLPPCSCWWWELVEVARKLVMTALVGFIQPAGSVTQMWFTALIALAFWLLSSSFSPFDDVRKDYMNFASQLSTVLTLLLVLGLEAGMANEGLVSEEFFAVLLTILQVIPPICVVFSILYAVSLKLRSQRARRTKKTGMPNVLLDAKPSPRISAQRARKIRFRFHVPSRSKIVGTQDGVVEVESEPVELKKRRRRRRVMPTTTVQPPDRERTALRSSSFPMPPRPTLGANEHQTHDNHSRWAGSVARTESSAQPARFGSFDEGGRDVDALSTSGCSSTPSRRRRSRSRHQKSDTLFEYANGASTLGLFGTTAQADNELPQSIERHDEADFKV